MKYIIPLLKSAMILLLIYTGYTTEHEYEYYELIRWIAVGLFAYFAWNSYQQKNAGIVILYVIGIGLFNPFKHPRFNQETWAKVDYAFAVFIAITMLYDGIKMPKKPPLNFRKFIPKITLKKEFILQEIIVLLGAAIIGVMAYFLAWHANEIRKADSLAISDSISKLQDKISHTPILLSNTATISELKNELEEQQNQFNKSVNSIYQDDKMIDKAWEITIIMLSLYGVRLFIIILSASIKKANQRKELIN